MHSTDAVYVSCLISLDMSVYMERSNNFCYFMDCESIKLLVSCHGAPSLLQQ